MGVNKVKYGENVVLDISSDTVTADKLLQGYTAHDNTGTLITGTATQGGTEAISVVDTEDTHGGTIRTITAVDISDTTAVASDVAQGKYFYTANGTKTAGTSSGGGGGLEYETGTWTPTEDVTTANISFSKTHATPPAIVCMSDTSTTGNTWVAQTLYYWSFINSDDLFGEPFGEFPITSASNNGYGTVQYTRRTTGTTMSNQVHKLVTSSSDINDDSLNKSRFNATATGFKAYGNNASTMWRTDGIYKWIAIWAPPTT